MPTERQINLIYQDYLTGINFSDSLGKKNRTLDGKYIIYTDYDRRK